jgi:putative nucleotidyltransferase with HDIG domain
MDKTLRILILEDVARDAELTELELQRGGVSFISKRVEAEKTFRRELEDFAPDLILSDYSLPSFDGLSALALVKEKCPHTPFIFVSGTMGEEVAIETLKNGATDYVLKQRLSRLVPAVGRAIQEAHERAERQRAEENVRRLNADLERSHAELLLTYDATLEGWSRALDLRDHGTEGHSLRVTEITLRLARTLGFSEAELVHIRRGALLHDIGKMGIPDRVLLKPGPLTPEEWDIMRLHPVYAYQMLSPIAYLGPALDIPFCHHEQWDGKGYPRGLKGERIPLAVRIFSIVDIWDALVSERPYHPAWPKEKVRAHLQSLAGTQLDPKVVDVFLRMEIRGELSHDCEDLGRNDLAV